MEEVYKLSEPRKAKQYWYVQIKNSKKLYLSNDIKIIDSNRITEAFNVGYWKTYEEALEAKLTYEKLHENKHDDVYDNIRYVSLLQDIPPIYKLGDQEQTSTRGNGGMVDYYKIPEETKQLSDLIYHKNMNHSVGEAFCALYRLNDNGEKKRNIRKVIRYMELELEHCGEDE